METAYAQGIQRKQKGGAHVSILENIGIKGAFRAATVQLRYKDEHDEWRTGTSHGASDLKHLENTAREASTRIENSQKATKAAAKPKAAA